MLSWPDSLPAVASSNGRHATDAPCSRRASVSGLAWSRPRTQGPMTRPKKDACECDGADAAEAPVREPLCPLRGPSKPPLAWPGGSAIGR